MVSHKPYATKSYAANLVPYSKKFLTVQHMDFELCTASINDKIID